MSILTTVFLFVSLFTPVLAAAELTIEQQAFSKKLVEVLKLQNAEAYKKLIHSKCPVDEGRIKASLSSAWTDRYQVRIKKVDETFDPAAIKFIVSPEYVMEFQVWTKKGATEVELVKAFPVAKDGPDLKIMEWPCFGPR